MVMDRNSKLAAARKKLAKFQESKTVTVNVKPNMNENISRDVIVNPTFATEQQSNGTIAPPVIPASMTSSTGNGFVSSNFATSGVSSLSALEQVEFEVTRDQLKEQAEELSLMKE